MSNLKYLKYVLHILMVNLECVKFGAYTMQPVLVY